MTEEFDPTKESEREIGREMVDKSTGLGSVLAHFYRGEMSRVTAWRQRLDRTTNLAVTVIAALLTWAFSSPDNPHFLVLIGISLVSIFLGIEARRFQDYDVWRSRARIMQENLFATALDPSQGVEEHDWREHLSRDYREPAVTMPYRAAVAHRLRRVYFPLFLVLLVAWIGHLTVFVTSASVVEQARVGPIPGSIIIASVALFYLGAFVLTFWLEIHPESETKAAEIQ
jgi:uncharacterized membrane protein